MKKLVNNTKGFTLIELMLVLSIISLLASIILSSLSTAGQKARDVGRLETTNSIKNALEMYYSDNGHYPVHNNSDDNIAGAGIPVTDMVSRDLASSPKNYIKTLPGYYNTPNEVSYYVSDVSGSAYELLFTTETPIIATNRGCNSTDFTNANTITTMGCVGQNVDVSIPMWTGWIGDSSIPRVTSFSANPITLPAGGGSSIISWSSIHATTCRITGGWSGNVAINGSQVVSLSSTQNYALFCSAGSQTASRVLTIDVAPYSPPPGGGTQY
jgi:prepilin-type N-terminal cleavage/methylation domain-containing protein